MNHAIRIHETGGPEKMVWEEVPLPAPKPGEALVRHKAWLLNTSDAADHLLRVVMCVFLVSPSQSCSIPATSFYHLF